MDGAHLTGWNVPGKKLPIAWPGSSMVQIMYSPKGIRPARFFTGAEALQRAIKGNFN